MLGSVFSRGLATEVQKSLGQIAARQLLGTTFLTSRSSFLCNQSRHATTTTTKVARTRTQAKAAPTKSKSTTAKKAAPRKKATTQTANPKKKAATTKTTLGRKAATNKTTRQRKAATTKTKLKRKAAPKKGTTTVKRKYGPKLKKKKALTPDQAARLKTKNLKQTALLVPQGKRLPQTAWMVFLVGHLKKGENMAPQVTAAGKLFKTLSPSALERLNHAAVENKRINDQKLKSWIATYTVDQIKLANNARRMLSRQSKASVAAGHKRIGRLHVPQLIDERAPKRPNAPYIVFSKERWASGDFKNLRVAEASRLIGAEWKALSADEAKKYREGAARPMAKA